MIILDMYNDIRNTTIQGSTNDTNNSNSNANSNSNSNQ